MKLSARRSSADQREPASNTWITRLDVTGILASAATGNSAELMTFVRSDPLRAVTPDLKTVFLMRDHATSVQKPVDGAEKLRFVNETPKQASNAHQLLTIINKTSSRRLPFPLSVKVTGILWFDGALSISTPTGGFEVPMDRILKSVVKLLGEVTEQQIETVWKEMIGEPDTNGLGSSTIDQPIFPSFDLPVALPDLGLGTFTREPPHRDMTGKWQLGERKILTRLMPDDTTGSYSEALALAQSCRAHIETLVEQAKAFAAQEFLSPEHYVWRTEDEQKPSASDFQSMLGLTDLTFNSSGEIVFWFEDGDSSEVEGLFWGHMVSVSWKEGHWLKAEMM